MREFFPRRRGFTLVELLVVIGIIALLISILLPALQKARKQANIIKCAANLRSIVQAMRIYAAQNNDYIPGSPWSSGAFLFGQGGTTAAIDPATGLTYNDLDCPSIVTPNDWESPVAQAMGINELPSDPTFVEGGTPHFNAGSDKASRLSRFEFLRKFPAFQCPENQVIAIPYSSSTLQCAVDVNVAYFQAFEFLLENSPTASQPSLKVNKTGTSSTSSVSTSGFTMTTAGAFPSKTSCLLPNGWVPKFSKVQNSVRKIALADGCRYNNPGTKPPGGAPDIDLNVFDSGGSNYGDSGAFSQSTHSWTRYYPGNPNGESPASYYAQTDYRLLSYRHGNYKPNATPGTLLFNCAFYDGHVETLDDVAGSDPAMWLPTGTILNVNNQFFGTPWADTAAIFNVPLTSTYTVP